MTPEKLESGACGEHVSGFEEPSHSRFSGVLIYKQGPTRNRFSATAWYDSRGDLRLSVGGRCSRPTPRPERVKTVRGGKWQYRSLGDILPCSADFCRHRVLWEAQAFGTAELLYATAPSYEAALLEARRLARRAGLVFAEEEAAYFAWEASWH